MNYAKINGHIMPVYRVPFVPKSEVIQKAEPPLEVWANKAVISGTKTGSVIFASGRLNSAVCKCGKLFALGQRGRPRRECFECEMQIKSGESKCGCCKKRLSRKATECDRCGGPPEAYPA